MRRDAYRFLETVQSNHPPFLVFPCEIFLLDTMNYWGKDLEVEKLLETSLLMRIDRCHPTSLAKNSYKVIPLTGSIWPFRMESWTIRWSQHPHKKSGLVSVACYSSTWERGRDRESAGDDWNTDGSRAMWSHGVQSGVQNFKILNFAFIHFLLSLWISNAASHCSLSFHRKEQEWAISIIITDPWLW